MASNASLPETMKALVQETKGDPLVLKTLPTPRPTPGSVVVKVLASLADANLPWILSNEGPFTYPIPFAPGARSVGRVAAVGCDTTSLHVDQLVLLDPWFIARDNPDLWILWGASDGLSPASRKWYADNWRYAAYAEYAKAPLENTWALNENRLCKELGYSIPELVQLDIDVVAFGGLRGINLKAGERLIVTPATGQFCGATVGVAAAMGAAVIAVGRNESALQLLKEAHPDLVETVIRTGDLEADTAAMTKWGAVDAFLEMTPTRPAEGSTHVKAAFAALKAYGRACFMGAGAGGDLEIGLLQLISRGLTVKGQCMYEREDVGALIKMAEAGSLKLGKKRGFGPVQEFRLDQVDEALRVAKEQAGLGRTYVIAPWKE